MKQKRAARKRARRTEVAAVSAKQQGTQARMTKKENREHKSSVFADLFYEDETAEKNLLSLYNALHSTNYRSEKRSTRFGLRMSCTKTSRMIFHLKWIIR